MKKISAVIFLVLALVTALGAFLWFELNYRPKISVSSSIPGVRASLVKDKKQPLVDYLKEIKFWDMGVVLYGEETVEGEVLVEGIDIVLTNKKQEFSEFTYRGGRGEEVYSYSYVVNDGRATLFVGVEAAMFDNLENLDEYILMQVYKVAALPRRGLGLRSIRYFQDQTDFAERFISRNGKFMDIAYEN